MNIQENLDTYGSGGKNSSGLKPTERYASFDYCYNYFQSFREQNNISGLVLQRRVESSQLRELAFAMREIGGVVATLIVDDQH